MANGFGSLYVGSSGLQNAQTALNVTANNLANVDTKGYVREQVRFSDKHYATLQQVTSKTNIQQSGLGVSIGDVVHARDIFLDKAYRQENSRLGFYETCYETTTYVEDLFQELDGERFKESVGDLWTAFQELSKSPADSTNQNLVLQKAELLVSRCQALYSDLQNYQSNINTQIQDDINRVNEIGNRIYQINLEIQKVESGKVETAMTLRDERDRLIDELSAYTDINVKEDATGFVFVEIDGVQFVDEGCCHNIGMQKAKGTGFVTPYWPNLSDVKNDEYVPVWKTVGNITIFSELGNDVGSIKAKLLARGEGYGGWEDLQTDDAYGEIRNSILVETEAQIDSLFHNIITSINDIFAPTKEITLTAAYTDAAGNTYQAGDTIRVLDEEKASYGADNELPPRELFTRIGVPRFTKTTLNGQEYYVYNAENPDNTNSHYAIGSVSVNEDLKKQITLMPAFTKNGAVNYELGRELAEAWDKEGMYISPEDKYPCNFGNFYDKIIGNLGTTGSIYYSATDTLTNTVTSVENQRQQVTGVSSDEELTKMIKYQSAYNAASRYITVISQMTELIVTGLI